MPRIGSRSRFSFLEKAAKQSGLQAAPNSPVGRYLAYKKTETVLKRRKTLTAAEIKAQRTQFRLALAPFGLNVGAAFVAEDFRIATVSQWSFEARQAQTGLTEADLGWRSPSADTPSGGDYYPAVLVVSRRVAGAAASTPASQITGREYKYYPTNSYSLPFGRTAAVTVAEIQRRDALFAAVKGIAGFIGSVSYKPEYFDPQVASSQDATGLTAAPVNP